MDIKKEIRNILKELGAPIKLSGTVMLRDIIEYSFTLKKRKYTNIYNHFAKLEGIGISCIERRLRYCIEYIFENGNMEYINKVFGSTINSKKCKATNSEFIETIIDEIKFKSK